MKLVDRISIIRNMRLSGLYETGVYAQEESVALRKLGEHIMERIELTKEIFGPNWHEVTLGDFLNDAEDNDETDDRQEREQGNPDF